MYFTKIQTDTHMCTHTYTNMHVYTYLFLLLRKFILKHTNPSQKALNLPCKVGGGSVRENPHTLGIVTYGTIIRMKAQREPGQNRHGSGKVVEFH